jgi:hypothetical protein
VDFKDKIKTISFAQAKNQQAKVTKDVHDNHVVEVTEHWEDRVDVNVLAPSISKKANS